MLELEPAIQSPFDNLDRLVRTFVREGSLLYPYRRDARKNRFGWHFGSLLPPTFCAQVNAGDRSWIQTECLIHSIEQLQPLLSIKIIFLQVCGEDLAERELLLSPLDWNSLCVSPKERVFRFNSLEASVQVCLSILQSNLFRLSVRVFNLTHFPGTNREEAMAHALISTHTLLSIQNGRFHSLIEPNPSLRTEAESCKNVGVWPVLAGDRFLANQIISSPFILYDYPELAPESPAVFCDCTEIDELLTLRLLTLTPTEQEAMRSTPEGALLLEKAIEISNKPEFLDLHGAIREKKSVSHSLHVGKRVRLKPKRRADIMDVILAGKAATICSVEEDVDGSIYCCVTIDDDPGKDLGHLGQPGHRFFFARDEMEPLS
jgi:hypothetical protein